MVGKMCWNNANNAVGWVKIVSSPKRLQRDAESTRLHYTAHNSTPALPICIIEYERWNYLSAPTLGQGWIQFASAVHCFFSRLINTFRRDPDQSLEHQKVLLSGIMLLGLRSPILFHGDDGDEDDLRILDP